jgi:hypothetical protein
LNILPNITESSILVAATTTVEARAGKSTPRCRLLVNENSNRQESLAFLPSPGLEQGSGTGSAELCLGSCLSVDTLMAAHLVPAVFLGDMTGNRNREPETMYQ